LGTACHARAVATYDIRLQGAIDAASVAVDAGDATDVRERLVEELEQRDVHTKDDAWIAMVVEGITSDPNFMTDQLPSDYEPEPLPDDLQD
jgi:hypothetical protein